jgi:hypothetical protein
VIADTLFYVGGAAVTSKFLLFAAVGALIGIGIRASRSHYIGGAIGAAIAIVFYIVRGCGGV